MGCSCEVGRMELEPCRAVPSMKRCKRLFRQALPASAKPYQREGDETRLELNLRINSPCLESLEGDGFKQKYVLNAKLCLPRPPARKQDGSDHVAVAPESVTAANRWVLAHTPSRRCVRVGQQPGSHTVELARWRTILAQISDGCTDQLLLFWVRRPMR